MCVAFNSLDTSEKQMSSKGVASFNRNKVELKLHRIQVVFALIL